MIEIVEEIRVCLYN